MHICIIYVYLYIHTLHTHTQLNIFYIMASSERKKGEDKGNKRSGKGKKKEGKGKKGRLGGSLVIVPSKFQSLFFFP